MPYKSRFPDNKFNFITFNRLFDATLDDLPVRDILPIINTFVVPNLEVSAQVTTAIDLSWSDELLIETGYEIEKSTDGETWALIHTTAANVTTYQDTSISEGNIYYYRVRGVVGDQKTQYSNIISFNLLPWVLSGGVWNDAGKWYDEETWID